MPREGRDHDPSSRSSEDARMWRWPSACVVGEGARLGSPHRTRSSGSTSRTRASGATIRKPKRAFPRRCARAGRLHRAHARPGYRHRRLQVGPRPLQPRRAQCSPSSRPSRTSPATASTTAMWGRTARSISAPWTTRRTTDSGAFWRWDGKELTQFHSGIVVTNGPAFSPDGRTLYATDTMKRTIYALDARAAAGSASRAPSPGSRRAGAIRTAWRSMRRAMSGSAIGAARASPASRRTASVERDRARPDRAGDEMRLRRAGPHDALHHHGGHRPRSAYRPDGGPSLRGRDRHPRPEDPSSSRDKHMTIERFGSLDGQDVLQVSLDGTRRDRVRSPHLGRRGARPGRAARGRVRSAWCWASTPSRTTSPIRPISAPSSDATPTASAGRGSPWTARPYELDANEGRNQLHGGSMGFGTRLWSIVDHTPSSVTLGLVSEDGDMGYPGRLVATCTYTLLESSTAADRARGDVRPADAGQPHHPRLFQPRRQPGHLVPSPDDRGRLHHADPARPHPHRRDRGGGRTRTYDFTAARPDRHGGCMHTVLYDINYVLRGPAGELRHAATLHIARKRPFDGALDHGARRPVL